nr:hypothetical protein [Tanacetum cinerariifolium]
MVGYILCHSSGLSAPVTTAEPVITVGAPITTAGVSVSTAEPSTPLTTTTGIEDVGAEADMTNLDTNISVSPIPTTRIHKDHPVEQIIGNIHSAPQTRRMTKNVTNHEPKKVIQALTDPSWIEAMQDELLHFKLNKARLVAHGYTQEDGIDYDEVFAPVAKIEAIRNKKDERGIVVRNKARLVAQGYTQKEEIDYDEVFTPVRIEAIRLFLAYASFKDFVVYQMDVKSAFSYGNIEEDVYVRQPPGFEDPEFPNRVYKVLCIEFEKLMHKKFQMSSMGELTFFLGLQVTLKKDGIFINQHKYVNEILKKFGFSTVKTSNTPMETSKPLMNDENAEEVDVHLCRSMIGSLMYLTSSRPDIMFTLCACARFQVTPKVSHLHAVKRIFRNLKGQPKLGLWYPKDSPFDLEAYTDSDYADASLDMKSTIGGCQFLGCRLISWQCKKQTVVADSTTESEYIAASNCYEQVLWIQNQLLDYGYNFMNTKIFIDNESTICIVKNPVFHSKTKHIEIRHHFIRDSYEKRLIQVIKIHTNHNVADLLTEAFDKEFRRITSKQGRTIEEIDENAKIALDDETLGRTNDDEMFGVDDLAGEEVVMETTTGVKDSATPTTDVTKDEVTMAQALAALKITTVVPTPRAKGVVFHKQKQSQIPIVSSSKDKGKAKMIEPEVPIKRKKHMRIDEELLAEKLQAREREEFFKVQKARLLVELIEKRKKHFVALRAQEKRKKPPIKTQMKSQMSTYLKHMGGCKQSHLKGRSFDEIKKLLDREMTKVNNFIAMDSEAQSSIKGTTEHLESNISKKQKVDENVEPAIDDSKELRKCIEIVPDDRDEMLIEATPISSRSPTIIDYKIHKEGKKTYFKIIRVDGNSQVYQTFEKMFKNFNREDLEVLWAIVKDRFKKEKPVDDMDNILFRTLKTMFEHYVEDTIRNYQQGLAKVKNWKLFESCGVYCITMQSIIYYLLVEKVYPLTKKTIHQLWSDVRLQVDYDVEMAYDLLRFIRKQLMKGYTPQ